MGEHFEADPEPPVIVPLGPRRVHHSVSFGARRPSVRRHHRVDVYDNDVQMSPAGIIAGVVAVVVLLVVVGIVAAFGGFKGGSSSSNYDSMDSEPAYGVYQPPRYSKTTNKKTYTKIPGVRDTGTSHVEVQGPTTRKRHYDRASGTWGYKTTQNKTHAYTRR